MPDTQCARCGTCCRKGGPVLHAQDRGFLTIRSLDDVVCLRVGEPAFDPRSGAIRPLERELIKIRGKGHSWECLHYLAHGNECGIYAHRPEQCRVLSCRQPDALLSLLDTPMLTRCDFIPVESGLWQAVQEHEMAFSVARALEFAGGPLARVSVVSAELDRLLRAELDFRKAVAAYVQTTDERLWAYFGRPLWSVLRPLGQVFSGYAKLP